MSESRKKQTLTTGPFHVPSVPDDTAFANDRLVIVIKNPTQHDLEASVSIETCNVPNPNSIIVLPFVSIDPEVPFANVPKMEIPSESCARIEIELPVDQRPVLRISTTGDYAVGEERPLCGLLEITAVIGEGRFLPGNAPGLFNSDEALFRYADFVVCRRRNDDDD